MPAITYKKHNVPHAGASYTALVDVIYMPDRKRRTQPRKIKKGVTFPATLVAPADIAALLAAKHIEPAAAVAASAPAAPAASVPATSGASA